MTSPDTLTTADAANIGLILSAITSPGNTRAKWSDDDVVRSGILRSVNPYDGECNTAAVDVRDMHVHITSDGGAEVFLPVRDVLGLMARGMFAIRA